MLASLDRLLEAVPDATVIADASGRIRAANERAVALLDVPRAALLGMALAELLPAAPLSASATPVELVVRRGDGSSLPVEVTFARVERSDGVLTSAALRDVSTRRREETALREAAEHFRRLFEDGPIAMSLVAEDYRLSDVNAAFCRLLGYTASELRQRTFADITHPDDLATSLRFAEEVFAGKRDGFSIDKRYLRKSGETVWVELTASLIRDADGRPLKTLAVAKDIGERRRELAAAQDAGEQRAARERLQAAEAERARWARELHDETLQGLAGLHVLLSSEIAAAPDTIRPWIATAQDQIENEMEKLRGLISELRPAALDELGLEASVRDLAARTQAIYGIEIDTTFALDDGGAPHRPAAEVETAAYRIVQESLSNAARHAGATRITVALAQRGGTLSVRVGDDGDGFDAVRETVGFGLRGMRERVELLDGRLAIDSHPHSGTEVTALLPVRGA